MNLPNALTVGRIAVDAADRGAAVRGFVEAAARRVRAVRRRRDHRLRRRHLARSRKQETDLGRLLDPLADKLLLVGTFVPMYCRSRRRRVPFVTPFGTRSGCSRGGSLAIVLGREVFMTLFRQAPKRRGVVIAAIGPAKWKTAFQSSGRAARTSGSSRDARRGARRGRATRWHGFALFNGTVGTLTMIGAVVLTVYSLVLYLRSFGRVLRDVAVDSDGRQRRRRARADRSRHHRRRAAARLHDRHQRRAPRARARVDRHAHRAPHDRRRRRRRRSPRRSAKRSIAPAP